MSLRVLLTLVLLNVLWSTHPALGKILLSEVSPQVAALLRYGTAWLSYLATALLLTLRPALHRKYGKAFLVPTSKNEGLVILFMGAMTFCLTPTLQLLGLSTSKATENALIIAIEPLVTVAMAWLFLRERLNRLHWIGFGLALLGFSFLAGLTPERMSGGWDAGLVGNLLIFCSLLGEGVYSVSGRSLMARHSPLSVFGSAITVGAVLLIGLTFLMKGGAVWTELSHLSWKSGLALLLMGPVGTMLGYLFWMIALSGASVASLALTLFVQPVFGALWGGVFLGERLSIGQWIGAGLILIAVSTQSYLVREKT